MDEPGTVFYLIPENEEALEIVDHEANSSRRRVDPSNVSRRFLRIGLDQPAKIPSRLVTFGRFHFTNDIILHKFPNTDQCYFDFHPITGELLLHDISKDDDTQLFKIGKDNKKAEEQICTSPRRCVVLLDKEWIFEIDKAVFRLIPRRAATDQDNAAFASERLAFVHQIPDEFRTFEWTIERLDAMGIQSDRSTMTGKGYNLRRRHPDGLKPGEELRCVERALLGSGGQGDVHRVVHLDTGDHYAQKTIRWRVMPEWGIYNESDYKARLLKEVNLVKKAAHPNIVPYLFHQGWELGKKVKLFMPVYDGNLYTLLRHLRHTAPDVIHSTIERMLHKMLLVLDHVHKQGIIHRDIKPANILFRGGDFFLTDFGVAKFVDKSVTLMGTEWYAAPEVLLQYAEQTPEVDIYSLGATLVDCYGGGIANFRHT
ncbi:Cell division control protein 15 [Pleurostoma richardsiae]|uniref:Cell division control protein 15 n=1 Tax=Pleurostoma richardsiae TaxID=41990 RepID=A0AA38R7N1_9PEZI|nr:Cell division control protein 15 [Pleurostoma richardsiae]